MPDPLIPNPNGFNRIKACRYGTMVYNINDWGIGQALDRYGEFSEGEAEVFRQIVRPGDVVFDVGANIGAHTVLFASLVGPAGVVIAFEPQRILFQTLCANMAVNSITQARCFNYAVGDTPGEIAVAVPDPTQRNNFGALSLGQGAANAETVPVLRLDSFDVPHCRMLKIDVEGMELNVLKGAEKLIERFRPLLYVENDRPEKSADLIRHIDSLGYAQFWHQPPLFNPDNFFKNPENFYPNFVSHNMICVDRSQAAGLVGLRPVEIPPAGG